MDRMKVFYSTLVFTHVTSILKSFVVYKLTLNEVVVEGNRIVCVLFLVLGSDGCW